MADITDRLYQAIERLEPVENFASAGPWNYCGASDGKCQCGMVMSRSDSVVVAAATGPQGFGDAPCPERRQQTANQHFIAAMRPTSEPEYYTRLLQDALAEIARLRSEQEGEDG